MSSQHLGPRGDSLVGRISMGIVVDISTVTWVYKTYLNMSIIYIYLELGGARLWVWVKPKAQEVTDDLAIIRVCCEVAHMPRSGVFFGGPQSIFWALFHPFSGIQNPI